MNKVIIFFFSKGESMNTIKKLDLITKDFEISSKIKSYYYNEQYKLWNITFFSLDSLFIYDRNIKKLLITSYDGETLGMVINGKMIKVIYNEK